MVSLIDENTLTKKLSSLASLAPQKADLRRDITAWNALIWAYRHENVRAASNAAETTLIDPVGYAQAQMERVGGSGAVKGYLEAHEDAVAIDAKVQAWFAETGRNWYGKMAAYAEAFPPRIPPTADELPRLRMVPRLKPNGQPWLEYPVSGRNVAYLCLVDIDGYTDRERAREQEFRDLFEALLDVMPGWSLTKWRIKGRGLTRG